MAIAKEIRRNQNISTAFVNFDDAHQISIREEGMFRENNTNTDPKPRQAPVTQRTFERTNNGRI